MKKESILFITSQLPYPPTAGGTIKSYKLVEYFSRHYRLTVGSLLRGNDHENKDAFLASVSLEHFYGQPGDTPRTIGNLAKSYIKKIPLNVYRCFSPAFAVETCTCAKKDCDILFVDHYDMFQYVPKDFTGKVVLHEHNAEYIMWKRFMEIATNPLKKLVTFIESKRIANYEREICRKSDIIFAAPNDIEELKKLSVDAKKFAVTYHLGDAQLLAEPPLEFAATEKALLYIGTLSWEANIDGLTWFLENSWENLKKKHPDLKCYIVGKCYMEGRNSATRLKASAKNDPDIIFTGFVDDVRDYYSRSRVFIAPLRFGSGLKVKVVNAMYRGIPTSTTSIGVEGLEAENMKHIAIADSLPEMEKQIDRLLVDRTVWEQMRTHSRQLAKEKYTWDVLLENMRRTMEGKVNVMGESGRS